MFNKEDWRPRSYKRLQDGDEMQNNDYDSAPEKPTYGMLLLFIMITSMTLNAILVSGGLYFYSKRGPWNPIFPQILYSPAQMAVEYKVVKFKSGFGSHVTEYQGLPSDELDQRWWDLYGCKPYSFSGTSPHVFRLIAVKIVGHSRITKEEATQMVNSTVPIPGDSHHYIVELNVFHQLHCLDTIRKGLYPDHYPSIRPGPNGEDEVFGREHLDHCVDSIRQSLMCSADISPITWTWSEKQQGAKAQAEVLHTCRDYGRLRDWALGRQLLAPFDPSVYVEDNLFIANN
ncbi:hypothetical protein JMJ35_008603 [Cladonia borealis]|uniref:Uncharacterized protein n=1 Tax=Cladonia borealis TaxID=184061 RepID=A0AA39UZ24_9LECA|nr:hypothetical protein JMJ35_008603 [Cladonia borealis]